MMVVQGRLGLLGFRPKRLYRVFLRSLFLGSLSKEPLQKANKIKRKKKIPELGHYFGRLEKRSPPPPRPGADGPWPPGREGAVLPHGERRVTKPMRGKC